MLRDVLADIAYQIERETTPHERRDELADGHATDVSMSARDLLPQEDREAVAWVREHGGLEDVRTQLSIWEKVFAWAVELGGVDACHEAARWVREHGGIAEVKEEWDRRSNLKRQLDAAQAKVKRQQRHIEFVQRKCRERQNRVVGLKKTVEFLKFDNSNFRALKADVAERLGFTRYGDDYEPEELLDTLDRRLMPEGMEWLVEAWPRFEDDAPLKFGDMALIDGEADMVEAVQLWIHGKPVIYGDGGSQQLETGERVKRPTPKVLAGDNEPLYRGEYVWHEDGTELIVLDFLHEEDGETIVKVSRVSGPTNWSECRSLSLTHERPDSWERLEEDARKHRYAYWECETFRCSACPAVVDGKNPKERYGVDDCQDAMQCDLVRRARALAEGGAR